MNTKYTIGIDIGGTNTDAVLVDNNYHIIASCKTATTANISDGFINAIKILLAQSKIETDKISVVNVGTTHATNALLEQKDLLTVGVIRIAGQNPILPPTYTWPENIRKTIYKGVATVNGGFECDGRSITTFNKTEIYNAAQELLNNGAQSIAIVGVFSSINNMQELEVENIVKEVAGKNFPVTKSYQIGGVGFIERENSTILNCALKACIEKGFASLKQSLESLNINAPLFMTQNNGTIIDINKAIEYPILTISAGPTNSFVGGSKLATLSNAIIVDIGGTSTDVGLVHNGFARRTTHSSKIAGISLNFAMPDVLSIALGGGSYIKFDNNNLQIGPESCAREILQKAKSFGGQILTVTDIALIQGYISIDGANLKLVNISADKCQKIMDLIKEKIINLATLISGPEKFPIVFVGGGANLLPKNFIENSIIPEHAGVANAYGAALAEISGNIDTVVSLDNRNEVIDNLKQQAIQQAINNGAMQNSTRIVDQQIIPYHYMPNNLARVIITASGKRM